MLYHPYVVHCASSMFDGAEAFNQPLQWDVSNVKSTSCMFAHANAFNQPLNAWSTVQVTR
jgi:hypothetical protein